MFQIAGHRILAEKAHDQTFPAQSWNGAETQIEIIGSGFEVDASVLRTAAFRNIQFGNQLDAGSDCGEIRKRKLHIFPQQTVNAEADQQLQFSGFNMDIAGVLLNRLNDHFVDQLDDSCFSCQGTQFPLIIRIGAFRFILFAVGIELCQKTFDLASFCQPERNFAPVNFLQFIKNLRKIVWRREQATQILFIPGIGNTAVYHKIICGNLWKTFRNFQFFILLFQSKSSAIKLKQLVLRNHSLRSQHLISFSRGTAFFQIFRIDGIPVREFLSDLLKFIVPFLLIHFCSHPESLILEDSRGACSNVVPRL